MIIAIGTIRSIIWIEHGVLLFLQYNTHSTLCQYDYYDNKTNTAITLCVSSVSLLARLYNVLIQQ